MHLSYLVSRFHERGVLLLENARTARRRGRRRHRGRRSRVLLFLHLDARVSEAVQLRNPELIANLERAKGVATLNLLGEAR